MIKNLKLTAKLFFKDIFLSLSFLAFFVYINYNEIRYITALNANNANGVLSYLEICLRLSIFCMVYFMFVSYEFFYKLKGANLQECINATNNGFRTLYGNQFLIMLGLDFIITLTFIIYNFVTYFSSGINHTEYLIHIILNIFVNIFLVSFAGIILGMCVALIFKRLKAYLLLTLFALLTSSIFESIAFTIFNTTGNNIYPIFEFFNLYPPALNWTPNSNFGFSLLPYRIELLLLWIFAFLSIVFLKLSKNNKTVLKLFAVFSIILCLTNVVLYLQPSSKVIMSNNPSASLTNDVLYYFHTQQKEEQADFEITKYDLDIKVTNLLSVKARLTLNKRNLPSYKFTLYRGYKVFKAVDENNNMLIFHQDGDYIIIENNNNSNLSEIVLSYAGYSPKFYSNSQGLCLPGYFPYYPHSGYKKVFDVDNQGFEKVLLANPVNFYVKIKSDKKVYSNLENIENGLFSGESNGITLMSGFLESTTTEGIEVIYPYLNNSEFNPEKIDADIKSFLQSKNDSQIINKIFILPNLNLSNFERTVLYSDYMTVQQLVSLPEQYVIQFINHKKLELYQLINFYQYNKPRFESQLSYEASMPAEFDDQKYATVFSEKIKQFGESVVLKKADAYINDDTDTRTIMEFLKQLQ